MDERRATMISKEGKDLAYWERNQLVAHLSKIYCSWLQKHPLEDTNWDDDWRNIVYIETPGGQCSWHIHDSELCYFQHLAFRDGNDWDGHSMEEKYKRLEKRMNIDLLNKVRNDTASTKNIVVD